MRPLNDMRLPGNFDEALQLLNGRLALDGAPRYNLIVCGGTALNATGLISRTTKDVDIVALMDDGEVLLDPAPLPQPIVDAALVVAENLGLPNDWLNNGPSSDDGGLFRLGLPEGIAKRLVWKTYGENLRVGFIHRFDQINFKLYAAVDQRGGYHADDLHMLLPTEGFLQGLKWFLEEFGYGHLVPRI
jgi:hypothetical protein